MCLHAFLLKKGGLVLKRLVILTVGKTHSGKTTFAQMLEKALDHSIVIDQDNHAAFINTYYKTLQPTTGPNTLKHAISQLMVEYAKEHSDCHLIICNANRNRKGREDLLENVFPRSAFLQIIVHFDLPDAVLESRVARSTRNKNIFRSASTFEEVLKRQQTDSSLKDISDPDEREADHLFVIRDCAQVDEVIEQIVRLAICTNQPNG